MTKNTSKSTALTLPALPASKPFDNYDEWVAGGKQLAEFGTMLKRTDARYQIIVGEWYKHGLASEAKWQRDNLASQAHKAISVERAARELGFERSTIANWGWVASSTAQLRSSLNGEGEDLSFEDLRVVATLTTPTDQRKWIAKKRENDWSASELRRQVAQASGKRVSPRGDVEREQAEQSALARLVEDWKKKGTLLMRKGGDDVCRAQGDVYLDCAARLSDALDTQRRKVGL